jgi:putative DNA primase/helicase
MRDSVSEFRNVMRAAGIEPPAEIVADGGLHRFRVETDRAGTRNGWYVLHVDGVPAGAFGSWRLGVTHSWCAKDKASLSYAERGEVSARLDNIKRQREAELTDSRAKARARALFIWRNSRPVESHPYLSEKRVYAYGIRQYKGSLIIPLRDTLGVIHSLQFIDAEGHKRFLSGGAITGHYHAVGKYSGTLCIAEGYATAATIHQTTGHACAVAFNAGNLKAVALSLRYKFPKAKLILCADNDRFTAGNPGVTKAIEASRAVRGFLNVPKFSNLGPYDFYREGGEFDIYRLAALNAGGNTVTPCEKEKHVAVSEFMRSALENADV